MSNGETNSVIINEDEMINIRLAWVAREPNNEMIREASAELVSCFESSNSLAVRLQIKTGNQVLLTDMEGFIKREHIPLVLQEWRNPSAKNVGAKPANTPDQQIGCVIIFPRRVFTEEVETEIKILQYKLKKITQNGWFKTAFISY